MYDSFYKTVNNINMEYAIASIDVEKNKRLLDATHKMVQAFDRTYIKAHFVTNFIPEMFISYTDNFHKLCVISYSKTRANI